MQANKKRVDLTTELQKLQHGECIWCELRASHPAYSLCPHREEVSEGKGLADAGVAREAPGTICRFGEDESFVLRLATTGEERLKCWHLVYREYVSHGYMKEKELEYRYSLHDALPDTATFMVEVSGSLVGTVTVFPDSPIGLPADEMYKPELDEMRMSGRLPVEVGRLVIGPEYMHEKLVLASLFDALSLHARRLMGATDLVITVNPSHAKFYERMILFETMAGERSMGSVCGAPAALLRLDLDLEGRMRRYAHGEGPRPEEYHGGRTFYPLVSCLADENVKAERIQRMRRPLSEDFLRRYFVWVRPLITSLPSSLKYFFEKCYPDYDLTGV